MKIWIDGEYFDRENAKISVFDHGLLYGDGVFEGIRIYHSRIFKLRQHVERLYASAKAIMLDIPMSIDEMMKAVSETVAVNEKADGYIRLVVTRGVGDLGISPRSCPKATVFIIADSIQLYPQELYEKGIPIITSSVRRIAPHQFDTRIKSLNYLNNILAKIEAMNSGCMEAVMLGHDGYVAECTADNIFIIKNSVLMAPSCSDSNLEGITRGTVIDLASSLGIRCREARMTHYDLYTADECFITGTGAEIMPVTNIDGRKIGSGIAGVITRNLRNAFEEFVKNA
jgi:branched-chain amino acid aminotransferase